MSFWANEDDEAPFYHENENEDEDENDTYPDSAALGEEIICKKAEYAFEMSKNSQFKSHLEKSKIENRRKQAIIHFYDDYIFDFALNDNGDMGIDNDYKTMIRRIQNAEVQRLEEEEMKTAPPPKHSPSLTFAFTSQTTSSITSFQEQRHGRMRSKSATHLMSANILYEVSKQNQVIEKEMMRKLKEKRYKVHAAKQKLKELQSIKRENRQKIQEMGQQITVKQRLDELEKTKNRIDELKKSKLRLCVHTANELNELKLVIESLMFS